VHLTATEFRLLAALITHPGRVLTHQQLVRTAWGPGANHGPTYLRVYVGRLRQKLEVDPARPAHLQTEIGVGYRFVPDSHSDPA
jgi:two-component system KDP operon response regulator KdpE